MAVQERAVLAGGCFWGMQDLIRTMPGVITTRVGYTGGDVSDATYRNHGTHAEGIEIMFDPAVLSYRQLLEFFSRSTIPVPKTAREMIEEARIAPASISSRRNKKKPL
jgi:peptide-methionine (S)-S-oxide reductase